MKPHRRFWYTILASYSNGTSYTQPLLRDHQSVQRTVPLRPLGQFQLAVLAVDVSTDGAVRKSIRLPALASHFISAFSVIRALEIFPVCSICSNRPESGLAAWPSAVPAPRNRPSRTAVVAAAAEPESVSFLLHLFRSRRLGWSRWFRWQRQPSGNAWPSDVHQHEQHDHAGKTVQTVRNKQRGPGNEHPAEQASHVVIRPSSDLNR